MTQWTPATRDVLRMAYNKAIKDGLIRFLYGGQSYSTDYVKNLLEYLDEQFKTGSGKTLQS